MRSKANIKSHPIHPILVVFPIAFFAGTFLFDLLSILLGKTAMLQTAFYLNIAGLGGGLLAAVPGLIDYLHTVPPNSSAKDRATKHALTNITMMIVFGIALLYRQLPDMSQYLLLVIDLVGVVLLTAAGWMGGTLVYRNQVGVDVRYAGAGKWTELKIENEKGKVAVANEDGLKPNQMKLLHVNGKRVVLARTEEGYVAFDDRCPHKGGSLAGGSLMCGTVQCPWHGSQFSVKSGAVTAGPSEEGITTFPVGVEAGKVMLDIDQVMMKLVNEKVKDKLD
ncbi:DUF2231 domain-containing protein [Aridibaculum aurantiacum]|uniref:DUF2231 domain-containing protein n=1 Tax=Aridibaculum aurantiacum TaxID=2810307 RepID=UPI001A96B5D8|nr:DUF2231 domain-containing protein [Aridibaculum aurantiacum]